MSALGSKRTLDVDMGQRPLAAATSETLMRLEN